MPGPQLVRNSARTRPVWLDRGREEFFTEYRSPEPLLDRDAIPASASEPAGVDSAHVVPACTGHSESSNRLKRHALNTNRANRWDSRGVPNSARIHGSRLASTSLPLRRFRRPSIRQASSLEFRCGLTVHKSRAAARRPQTRPGPPPSGADGAPGKGLMPLEVRNERSSHAD